ncbi:hypothetical protein I7I48_10650 [Histoplasma ohiense]|nr:hypothetical protein I7I48_10650 [Histoplasma ohiense (nom. inval.)]
MNVLSIDIFSPSILFPWFLFRSFSSSPSSIPRLSTTRSPWPTEPGQTLRHSNPLHPLHPRFSPPSNLPSRWFPHFLPRVMGIVLYFLVFSFSCCSFLF